MQRKDGLLNGAVSFQRSILPLVAALAGAWLAVNWVAERCEPWEVRMEVRSSVSSVAQLFFRDQRGFREADSVRRPVLAQGDGQELVFPLSNRPLSEIRFDPLLVPGEVEIRAVVLARRGGAVLRSLPFEQWQPYHQIEVMEVREGSLFLRTTSAVSDPNIRFDFGERLQPPRGLVYFGILGGAMVFGLLGGAMLGMVLPGLAVRIWGWVLAPWIQPREVGTTPRTEGTVAPGARRRQWWLAVLMVAMILGARWWMVGVYGSDLPFWDQWDSDGDRVLVPWVEGRLDWAELTAPHNEHRILWTRLVAWGSLALNGQWDARLQAMINAAIPAFTGAFLWMVLLPPGAGRGQRWGGWFLLTAVFSLPFAWENILASFQSQFQFKALFAILALWGMTLHRVSHPKWWMGLFFAIAGVYTMASGLLGATAVGAVAAFLLLWQWPERGWQWGRLLTFAVCFLLSLWAYAQIPQVSFHAGFAASTVGEFLRALGVFLLWPVKGHPLLAVLAWLPFLGFVLALWCRWIPVSRREVMLLGLGAWVLLMGAASAYSRGADVSFPISRYSEPLAYGLIVNAWSLWTLLNHRGCFRERVFRFWRRYAWVYGSVMALAVGHLSIGALAGDMPRHREILREMEERTALYVQTGDLSVIKGQWYWALPYPNPERLLFFLNHEGVRDVLPASVREPLPWRILEVEGRAFGRDLVPGNIERRAHLRWWGSYSVPEGIEDHSELPWRIRTFRAAAEREQRLPYLLFYTSGLFNADIRGLFLVSEEGVTRTIERPMRRIEDAHRTLVKTPGASFEIHAKGSERRGEWIAFTEPRSMAAGSYWALRLADGAGWLVLLAAWGAFLLYRTEQGMRVSDRSGD